MLDIAWPELIVIGAVALVAIGPKDLPKAMRMIGRWAGKARNMAHDLQRSFEQLEYESEIAEKLKTDTGVAEPQTTPPKTVATEAERHDRPGSA